MENEAWRDRFGSVYGGPVRPQRIDKEATKDDRQTGRLWDGQQVKLRREGAYFRRPKMDGPERGRIEVRMVWGIRERDRFSLQTAVNGR